jgi:hypothetical protein
MCATETAIAQELCQDRIQVMTIWCSFRLSFQALAVYHRCASENSQLAIEGASSYSCFRYSPESSTFPSSWYRRSRLLSIVRIIVLSVQNYRRQLRTLRAPKFQLRSIDVENMNDAKKSERDERIE